MGSIFRTGHDAIDTPNWDEAKQKHSESRTPQLRLLRRAVRDKNTYHCRMRSPVFICPTEMRHDRGVPMRVCLLYPRSHFFSGRFDMPVHHIVEPDLRLVLINLIGIVTNNDLIECQAKLMSNPLFEGNFDRLVDASDAITFDVTQNVVRGDAKAAVEGSRKRAALDGTSDRSY